MASKNLRKIRQMGLSGFGFTADFNPNKYSRNWDRFQKYVAHKEASMVYQSLMRSLYKEEVDKYLKGGHKVGRAFRKEIKAYAKARAKEITQAKVAAASNPTQQSFKEQEAVLAEG